METLFGVPAKSHLKMEHPLGVTAKRRPHWAEELTLSEDEGPPRRFPQAKRRAADHVDGSLVGSVQYFCGVPYSN